jgi:hypothetical protein
MKTLVAILLLASADIEPIPVMSTGIYRCEMWIVRSSPTADNTSTVVDEIVVKCPGPFTLSRKEMEQFGFPVDDTQELLDPKATITRTTIHGLDSFEFTRPRRK